MPAYLATALAHDSTKPVAGPSVDGDTAADAAA